MIFKKIIKFLTTSEGTSDSSENREILTPENRDIPPPKFRLIAENLLCPYCSSKNFVRRGFRKKKYEKVQLFFCLSCKRTFTGHSTKGKHYPLSIMLDAISIYNLGYSLEETCRIIRVRNQNGVNLQPSTLSDWLTQTAEFCKFSRMREFAMKKHSPKEIVVVATLAHQQLYRYRFHRGKCDLMILEEYQHRKFVPLREFLEMVPAECPHQFFQEGLRASEAPLTFSKTQMIVRAKSNYATRLTSFILQSVKERKLRHEALQKFFLANDSVTVATEVPVYITKDDLLHMQTQLDFKIYPKIPVPLKFLSRETAPEIAPGVAGKTEIDKNSESARDELQKNGSNSGTETVTLPRLITGHIDILQIRNGQIHILDYKPQAEKERPIDQLTIYAMALSRLTGLRLFEFKCAWFDEKDYFEFYPLHVLHKPKKGRRRRKVCTMEGTYNINRDEKKISEIRPTL